MSRDLFCPTGRIYRGNLHGHCTHSDGRNEAAEVVRLYREAGYDFTCLSDHYWTDPRYSAETVCDSSGLDSDDFITIIWAFTDMSVAGRAGITYITLMRPSFPIRWYAALVGLLWLLALPAQAGQLAGAIDEIDADVLFLRHALAPGFGDPANFSIHDCRTQRNLSQAGREQSRRIGQYLRDEAIGIKVILSSRWCRCVETAAELGLGPFTTHEGLNSFFDGHVDRAETIRLLRAYLDSMKASPANGSITLMVTHQVVITAITGIAPQSGGFVAYNSRTGAVKRAGTPVQP